VKNQKKRGKRYKNMKEKNLKKQQRRRKIIVTGTISRHSIGEKVKVALKNGKHPLFKEMLQSQLTRVSAKMRSELRCFGGGGQNAQRVLFDSWRRFLCKWTGGRT